MSLPVPAFPDFREIELADKELLENHLKKVPATTSEFTFANFFIWRNCDRSKMTSIYGNLCVAAYPENEPPYFFEPLGSNEPEKTVQACLSRVPRFSRVTQEFVKRHFEGKKNFKIEADRDNSDYVYRNEELIALKGKKFDGKRNRIKRFLKNNIPIYKKITSEDVHSCLSLLNKWKKTKGGGVCFGEPIREALKNYNELELKGAAILVKGKIEAFTIGEQLNSDTAVIYIEVANPDIEGLSQYINQQFCRNEWSELKYINREQDLGDAGLRRAKLSYHPAQLIDKYNVTLID